MKWTPQKPLNTANHDKELHIWSAHQGSHLGRSQREGL
jgi:hypothetical protein